MHGILPKGGNLHGAFSDRATWWAATLCSSKIAIEMEERVGKIEISFGIQSGHHIELGRAPHQDICTFKAN